MYSVVIENYFLIQLAFLSFLSGKNYFVIASQKLVTLNFFLQKMALTTSVIKNETNILSQDIPD